MLRDILIDDTLIGHRRSLQENGNMRMEGNTVVPVRMKGVMKTIVLWRNVLYLQDAHSFDVSCLPLVV